MSIDLLEHVERAADGLVVGGVHSPRPAVLGEDANDILQFALHLRRHVGTRLAEILEVGGGEDQHLAGAVVPEEVVALFVFRRPGPVEEVVFLTLGLLSEQVVGEADGELTLG